MNIEILNNTYNYIAPFNTQATDLNTFLNNNLKINLNKYIDNYQSGEGVVNSEQIDKDFDFIIIISPNYYKEITKNLISKGIKSNKIVYALSTDDTYKLYSSIYTYQLSLLLHSKKLNLAIFYDYYKLYFLKNKHLNSRAFILGNGPSLTINDMNKLKNEITFAANKIYLAFSESGFRPTYYFVTDQLVYKQNYDQITNLNLTKLFSDNLLMTNKRMKNSIYFPLNFKTPVEFGTNYRNMYSGSTVVFVMIEFAIYMGIKELYILGLDFSFNLPSKSNIKELISEGEVNHFHKDYRKVGEKWTLPNMEKQIEAFKEAKKYADQNGIKIFNVSRETKLEVFDKISLDDVI